MNNTNNMRRLCAVIIGCFLALAGAQALAKEAPKGKTKAGAHPPHTEVMKRDRNLARDANKHYGDLSGHYNQIQKQDTGIRVQDFAADHQCAVWDLF